MHEEYKQVLVQEMHTRVLVHEEYKQVLVQEVHTHTRVLVHEEYEQVLVQEECKQVLEWELIHILMWKMLQRKVQVRHFLRSHRLVPVNELMDILAWEYMYWLVWEHVYLLM